MRDQTRIADLLRQNAAVSVKIEEPMSRHTTFGIGGPADLFVEVNDAKNARWVLSLLKEHEIPCMILGKGSNLLVSDAGICGAVVKYCATGIECCGTSVVAGAGVSLAKLATYAMQESLAGLAFAHGIPGTLGGACVMNAGAYGGEMKDVVVETTYLDSELKECVVRGEEHEFGYRTSIFKKKPPALILGSTLKLTKGDPEEIRAEMADYAGRRREKQPLEYPSAGSTFKRPEGHFAGALIEQCGLKGLTVGGAQVSEKHAGFVINRGGATAQDVKCLIEQIQEIVLRETGVVLECEICIL
ncbi:MAG: UDP-N-acetylmuramate dehydrogenase [Oscillospiraceae bacterium]|nr:UDP-N-acetylmuramate dehydrogenase [Oscillospiraceae bacterium]